MRLANDEFADAVIKGLMDADSGMIPWLLIAELISTTGKSLSELVGERMARYPASGEINRKVRAATGPC